MAEPYDYARPVGFSRSVPHVSNGMECLRMSHQHAAGQRLLSRQLSLREAHLTAPLWLPNGGPTPRRHHSDDAIERHRDTRATGLVRSFSNRPINGAFDRKSFESPSTDQYHRHDQDKLTRQDRASDLDHYHSNNMQQRDTQLSRTTCRPKSIIRDSLPRKPARQVIRQYYEIDDNCDSDEQLQERAYQQASSLSVSYEQQQTDRPRRPIRSQSVRQFESCAEGPMNSYVTERKTMPQLARSMSEHVIGEHSRTARRPISRSMSLDEDCEPTTIDPRSLVRSANVSLSNIGQSAHVRSSPPRGNSKRGGLRAQASLRSISETGDFAGDGLSDVTGDYTGSNSSKKVDNNDETSTSSEDTDTLTDEDEHDQNGASVVKMEESVPMIAPLQTMRVLSFGRLEKAVEVSPGIYMRLRDAKETWDAIEQGHFVKASCGNCDQATIYCIDSASYVSCPSCKYITEIDNKTSSGGGVGLGFTPSMFRTCNLVGSRSVAKNAKHDRRAYR